MGSTKDDQYLEVHASKGQLTCFCCDQAQLDPQRKLDNRNCKDMRGTVQVDVSRMWVDENSHACARGLGIQQGEWV